MSLKKLSQFLNKPLEDKDLPNLMKHLHFENLRKNPAVNFAIDEENPNKSFIRRGKVGGNPEMTAEISKKFDEWTAKSLEAVDFKFTRIVDEAGEVLAVQPI